MKTTLLLTFLFIFSFISIAQKCIVSGEIKGLKNDTLSIMFLPLKQGETPIIDQVVCVNGKMYYEVNLLAPLTHLVRISSKKWNSSFSVNTYPFNFEMTDINLFINSGDKINFKAEPDPNGIYLQAFGNKLNEQRNELLTKLYPLHKKLNSDCFKYVENKKLRDSLQTNKDIGFIEKIIAQINTQTIDFIVKHPDWEISAEVLMGLPTDSCYKYFPILSDKIKSSFFGKYASDILYSLKTGDIAPDFSLPNQNGKTVTLEEFKGRYVVVEFWGSWCGWCIKDIPKMKQYFNKYKNEATFVSIACRDNEANWGKAIAKNEMTWTNLLNNDDELTKNYGIEGYPTKVIIDKNGIVVGKYLGEGRDFYTELDRLFKN